MNKSFSKYSAYCTTFGHEDNIVAFKAGSGVGYKLFANGQKGGVTAKTGDDYQWLGDIPNLTTGYIGKMDRLISSSSYPSPVQLIISMSSRRHFLTNCFLS